MHSYNNTVAAQATVMFKLSSFSSSTRPQYGMEVRRQNSCDEFYKVV